MRSFTEQIWWCSWWLRFGRNSCQANGRLCTTYIKGCNLRTFGYNSKGKDALHISNCSFLINCAVYFADVEGFGLDSHHGFVFDNGMDRAVELGMWQVEFLCFFMLNCEHFFYL